MIPTFMEFIEPERKKLIPNLQIDCPIKPGPFYATNVDIFSQNDNRTEGKIKKKTMNPFDIPNGKYRYTLSISSKTDPNVYSVQWQVEIKSQHFEDQF